MEKSFTWNQIPPHNVNSIIANNLPLCKKIVLLRDAYSVWWWKQNQTDEIRTNPQSFYIKCVFKIDVPYSNILTDVYISLSTDWWSLSVKLFIQNQNSRMRTMKMCQWFSYLSSKGDNLHSIIIYVCLFKWIAIWRVIDLAPDTHVDDLFELKSNNV